MSSFLAQSRARALRTPSVSSLRAPSTPPPRLRVVPVATGNPRRVPFVALVVAVLAAGLVGLLVLNTSLQRGAYTVTHLRDQAADLRLRQQNLQLDVAQLQAPQRVAEEALAIGMVQGGSPAFLSLATGEVIGEATPGERGNQPQVGSSVSTPGFAGKATPLWAGMRNSGTTGVERAPSPDREPARRAGTAARPQAVRDPVGQRAAGRHPADRRSGQDIR